MYVSLPPFHLSVYFQPMPYIRPVEMHQTNTELAWFSLGCVGYRLTLSSLPQILRAGGKADCMARRAFSQETMWRRYEWGCPRFCPHTCQEARPC